MRRRVLITLLTALIMSTGLNRVPAPAEGGEITAPYLLPDRMTPFGANSRTNSSLTSLG